MEPHISADPLGTEGLVGCVGADLAHRPLRTEIHSWGWGVGHMGTQGVPGVAELESEGEPPGDLACFAHNCISINWPRVWLMVGLPIMCEINPRFPLGVLLLSLLPFLFLFRERNSSS